VQLTADRRSRWGATAVRLSQSWVLGAALVIAAQLKVVWDVWATKDLVAGDTSSYFLDVAGWAHQLHDSILWSPLYTNVWGSLLWLTGSVPDSSLIVRLGTILIVDILVFAIARRLAGPALGLLVALWWVVLPPNFDVLYDVHLYGVILPLLGVLLLLRDTGSRTRGIVLGIFVGSTLLLRNELLLATLALFATMAWVEWRRGVAGQGRRLALHYGTPLVVVLALGGFFYERSHVKGSQLGPVLGVKHTLNICQAYAFNFQQRHPESFTGNPFIDCQPLIQATFEAPTPTFTDAVLNNPRAMAAYVAWNGRLMFSGLQVALFGKTSTADQPDYTQVETNRAHVLLLTAFLLQLIVAGAIVVWRDRQYWRRTWLPEHAWGVLVLLFLSMTAVIVGLTQRPRAEYLFALTFTIMLAAAVAVRAILRRAPGFARLPAVGAFAVAAAILLAVPSHYRDTHGRPILDGVRRLEPVRDRLTVPGSTLISDGWGGDICRYLAESFREYCLPVGQEALLAQVREHGWKRALEETGADVVYVSESFALTPEIATFVARAPKLGWTAANSGESESGAWKVFVPSERP
jgi:hypothetical protein